MDAMRSTDVAGDVRYPLVYRVTFAGRIAAVFLCVLFGAGGLMLLGLTAHHLSENIAAGLFLVFIAATLVLGSAAALTYAFRAQMTIGRDTFEFRRLFQTIRLSRADILGRRYNMGRSAKYPVLVRRHGAPLVLQPNDFGLDGWFDAWFLALPDLDAQEHAAELDAIAKDASLGVTTQERLDKLADARRLAKGLNVLAVAVALWVFAFPHPYPLAIAAIVPLPWIAAAMLWARPGLYQLDSRPGDVKASVFGLVLAPIAALIMRALLDASLIDLEALYVWGVAVGLATLLAFVAAPVGKSRRAALIMLPFFLAYGVSMVALADMAWDSASPKTYRTKVIGKYVQRGKSRTYYLELARWNPAIDKDEAKVSSSYYYSVAKGDAVCVYLHAGTFGLRWMQVASCAKESAP
jgi:hypothetical protein